MIIYLLMIALGFGLLVYGADRFIVGAAGTAKILGMPPLLIGLTFVALGTSFPEMVVSFMAALQGKPDIAIGNALGSNIINIGFALGLTAIIFPLQVHSKIIKREFPLLGGIILLVGLLMLNGQLSRLDGFILLLGLLCLIAWLIYQGLQRDHEPLEQEYSHELLKPMPLPWTLFWFIFGAALLPVGAQLIIYGASHVARTFGVSELVIGLTIVAFGTSLPEFMASFIAAMKKEYEIAIGNVVGSNMFNLLGVLGLPVFMHPTVLDPQLLWRDYSTMVMLTGLLFIMAYGFGKTGRINRFEGSVLFAILIAYTVYLYI